MKLEIFPNIFASTNFHNNNTVEARLPSLIFLKNNTDSYIRQVNFLRFAYVLCNLHRFYGISQKHFHLPILGVPKLCKRLLIIFFFKREFVYYLQM